MWDAATPLMLAKLQRERVGVLIMGVAVWAGGMTSTPGPRGDRLHRFSNDGVVALPGGYGRMEALPE